MNQLSFIWVVVSDIFYFHPYLGKWSNLTNIFSDGLVQPPTSYLLSHRNHVWLLIQTGSPRWFPKRYPLGNSHKTPLGKGKSSTQKCRMVGDMLVPRREDILYNASHIFSIEVLQGSEYALAWDFQARTTCEDAAAGYYVGNHLKSESCRSSIGCQQQQTKTASERLELPSIRARFASRHGKVPCFKRTKPCSWLSSEDFRLMGLARWILLFLEELLIGPLALSTKIQGDLESELTHGNPQK